MATTRIKNISSTNTNPQSGQYMVIDGSATQKIDYSTLKSSITSDIGTVVTGSPSSNISIPSATVTLVTSISLPAGTWLVEGYVHFSTHTNEAYHLIAISTTSGDVTVPGRLQVASSAITRLSTNRILELSSTTTVYLYAQHGAGSSLTINSGASNSGLTAVRIK